MFITEIKSQPGEDISILIRPYNQSWNYLCDCGDASNLSVKECQNIQAIFISHTHIDHFVNFDHIIRHQIASKLKVVICGPLGIGKQVQSKLKGYTWNLIQKGDITYEIREIVNEELVKVYELEPPVWDLLEIGERSSDNLFENDAFNVYFTILDHKIPSISYLFKEVDSLKINLKETGLQGGKWVNELKKAYINGDKELLIAVNDQIFKAEELYPLIFLQKGHTVGVIMDHAATLENHQKIKRLFQYCDTVFIECFYKKADCDLAERNYHSYSDKSGQIMRECLVKEAVPVHFSRKYNEEDRKDILREFELAYKCI